MREFEAELEPQEVTTEEPSAGEKGGETPRKEKESNAELKELRELRKQFEAVRKELQEVRESEKYWAEQVRRQEQGQREQEEPDEVEQLLKSLDEPAEDDPAAVLDELAQSGIKALAKRGVLTKKEAASLMKTIAEKVAQKVAVSVVQRERQAMSLDAQVLSQYPDLANQDSPLYQETAAILRQRVKLNPKAAKDPTALLSAAETASLRLKLKELEEQRQSAKRERRRTIDYEDYEETGYDEDERLRRVRAQAPERGRRVSAFDEGGDEDEPLPPTVRRMLEGLKISEEDYRRSKEQMKRAR